MFADASTGASEKDLDSNDSRIFFSCQDWNAQPITELHERDSNKSFIDLVCAISKYSDFNLQVHNYFPCSLVTFLASINPFTTKPHFKKWLVDDVLIAIECTEECDKLQAYRFIIEHAFDFIE